MPLSEEVFFSFAPGCPTHGEEHMRECSMCGIEFCTLCFRRSVVCPDCAADTEEETEEEPDFEDVTHVDDFVEEDDEVEKIIQASEDMPPPEDLSDDTRAGDTRAGEPKP